MIYVIGIPIIFALMLRKLNKRAKGSVVKIWIGPLYHCYKPNFYWMETIIFIRRLALAGKYFILRKIEIFFWFGVFQGY